MESEQGIREYLEEWEGLREWQHDREMEAALEIAIESGDKETIEHLLMDLDPVASSFTFFASIVAEHHNIEDYLHSVCLDSMTQQGNTRLRKRHYFIGKKYQAKGDVGWRTAEDRDMNKLRFRLIKKTARKMESRDLEEMDLALDTEPRIGGSRVWSFGSEEESRKIIRLIKVTPFPRRAEVILPDNPVYAEKSSDDGKKYDRRLRGCAPMTSKSSPFSSIR